MVIVVSCNTLTDSPSPSPPSSPAAVPVPTSPSSSVKICDFTTIQSNDYTLVANPGDTLQFLCKMNVDAFASSDINDYAEKKFCFEYIIGVDGKIKKLEEYIRGSHSVKQKIDSSNKIYYSEVTLAPLISEEMSFYCSCYEENDDKSISRKMLTVNVRPSFGTLKRVTGCNFSQLSLSPKPPQPLPPQPSQQTQSPPLIQPPQISHYFDAFSTVQENFDTEKNICNITINLETDGYVTLFCPATHIIQPPDCFENVFIYRGRENKNKKTINENEKELIQIETLLGSKIIKDIKGDKKFIFGKIVNNAEKNSVFFCTCTNENGEKTDEFRMNIHVKRNKLLDEHLKMINPENIHNSSMSYTSVDNNDPPPVVVNPSDTIDQNKENICTYSTFNKTVLLIEMLLLILTFFIS